MNIKAVMEQIRSVAEETKIIMEWLRSARI